MVSFNNSDLYEIVLNKLRKDRKGGINVDEFESFLRYRNIDYFNQKYAKVGEDLENVEALAPFTIFHEPALVQQQASTGMYFVYIKTLPTGTTTTTISYEYLESAYAHLINAFYSASATVWSSVTEIDIVSHAEYYERLNNAITGPSSSYPIGYIDNGKLWLGGITSGYVLLDYYKYPADPYYDYYTDASGNITYLTDGQSAYTLTSEQIARDGSTAGSSVTSASQDLEWGDDDAMNILDMVMSDISVALSDPSSFQASLLERQNNAS